MAHTVTVVTPPYTPVKFPPCCSYCLAPATTHLPVRVSITNVRVSTTRTTAFFYTVDLPYCDQHAHQTRQLQRYDRWATIGLVGLGVVLLLVTQLLFGAQLRLLGPGWWFAAMIVQIGLVLLLLVILYLLGLRWLQRFYPDAAQYYFRRGLGITTTTTLASRPLHGEPVQLAITFSFANQAFAEQMTALHQTAPPSA